VSYAHIEELDQLIDGLKGDDAIYQSAVALAKVNVVSQSTLLVQTIATASASAGSLGFDAGLQLDINGTTSTTNTTSTTAVGSTVSGHNVSIKTGGSEQGEGNSVTIRGSGVVASGAIDIATDTLNIESTQNTYQSTNETGSSSISMSQTITGAALGGPVSASVSGSQSQSQSW